jgi:hypothetical protein
MTDTPAVATPTLPATLDPQNLVKLAKEIAVDIRDLPVILKDYGLSKRDFENIKEHPAFKRIYDAAVIEWNSADSTNKRLNILSAFGLEQCLPHIIARIMRQDEDLNKIVAAGKLLSDIAGVGPKAGQQSGSGEKFSINISLGADTKIRVEKDITPAPPEEIQHVLEGTRDTEKV